MILVIYMDFQQFNYFFTTDFNIDSITCTRGEWTLDKRAARAKKPRRNTGLFLLTDYPALFELPDGSEVRGEAGDVILLPKGARYTLRLLVPSDKTGHPILLNFRPSTPEGQEAVPACGVRWLCRDDGSLLPLFTAALRLYTTASPAQLKSTVYDLFSRLFPVNERDDCCINYIHRHYTDRFSIPALAKRCSMSETTYRKSFKKLTGLSPVQYINHLKIEKACQMLSGDDIRLQDISDFLQFYSLPYFYKVFKDHTGLTPNQYLNKIQNL